MHGFDRFCCIFVFILYASRIPTSPLYTNALLMIGWGRRGGGVWFHCSGISSTTTRPQQHQNIRPQHKQHRISTTSDHSVRPQRDHNGTTTEPQPNHKAFLVPFAYRSGSIVPCGCGARPLAFLPRRSGRTPRPEEMKRNSRSISARLRVLERIETLGPA